MARASEAEVFKAIGRFVYQFSQLEYIIRVVLGTSLRIPEGPIFAGVTSAYDFASLCRVTCLVLKQQPELTATQKKSAEKLFLKECLALNDQRVKVAHGMWFSRSDDSVYARYISRQSLKVSQHFDDIEELQRLTETAMSLIGRAVPFIRGGLEVSETGE